MKRHTFISDDYYAISGEENFEDQDENYCGAAIDKLAYYEDLEEQGRLVILPCKMKDTLFMIKDGEVYSGTVRFLRWEYHKDRGVRSDIAANPNPYFSIGASFDDFGKTVFLTREEAEAALKGE
jgi:hypothetical protein